MRTGWLAAAFASLMVTGAVLVLRGVGALEPLELALYDHYLERGAAARQTGEAHVVLVQVTEPDIRELGFPVSDRDLGRALQNIAEAGARVIGLDIYRDLPVGPGDASFRRLLRDEPSIVGVHKFGVLDEDGIAGPPGLAETGRIGFNDLLPDRDEVVRRGLLYLDDGGAVDSSFALVVALMALAQEGIRPAPDPHQPEWLRLGETTLRPFHASDGGYAEADDGGYQFLLGYDGAHTALPTYRLGDVVRGEVDPDRFRDRVVVVGTNAASVRDTFRVPVGEPIPGMEVHARIIEQLLSHASGTSRPRWVTSDWQEAFLVLGVALAGCLLGGLGVPGRLMLSGPLTLLAVLLGVGALWAVGGVAFRAGGWVPMAAPGLAWIGSVGLVTTWVSSRERAAREELMRIFSRTVSSEVAEEIWRNRADFFPGRPRPQRLTATVLFVDMRGYTAQSEKMEPEELMEWSNRFLERMAEHVNAHGGVVDDYFGDGIKANFGVPIARTEEDAIREDARRALACAAAMAGSLGELNAGYRSEGLPTCEVRIGLNTGPVVAVFLGAVERLKYTVVGDVVVTAQRLESTDAVEHDYTARPCRVLLSEATRRLLEDDAPVEDVGEVTLRGRAAPVRVFRLRGDAAL